MDKSIYTSERSVSKSFWIGCLSGALGTVVLQPLDVMKTRLQSSVILGYSNSRILTIVSQIFQNQSELIYYKCHYKSPIQFLRSINNFWIGTCPALWRCIPGVGGYFLSLNSLKHLTNRCKVHLPDYVITIIPQSLEAFILGFTARSMVVVALNPFLVIKTQMESGIYSELSMGSTFKRIYMSSHLKGLFSGTCASIMRDSPYSGIYLTAYTGFRHLFGIHSPFTHNKESSLPTYQIVMCASLSALVATTLTQPADILRTHRQLIHNTNQNRCGNFSAISSGKLSLHQIFQNIYNTDGFFGIWRGMVFRLIRRTVMASISWTLFESFT